MNEVSQQADYFAYWCLSDVYDQLGYGAESFHGNYGMLSLQGLRKPHYHAFELLGKLGNERVDVDVQDNYDTDGAIATREGNRYDVLVYSFEAGSEYSQGQQAVKVTLPAGQNWQAQHLTLHCINNEENNILSHWQTMGSPAYLRREQLRELQAQNSLKVSGAPVELMSGSGSQNARFVMKTPGVALLQCATK
jgi:xylan 1,4-beta-xylosidase